MGVRMGMRMGMRMFDMCLSWKWIWRRPFVEGMR